MARTLAELPKGSRITAYISPGVLAKTFPLATVKSVLAENGRESIRHWERNRITFDDTVLEGLLKE